MTTRTGRGAKQKTAAVASADRSQRERRWYTGRARLAPAAPDSQSVAAMGHLSGSAALPGPCRRLAAGQLGASRRGAGARVAVHLGVRPSQLLGPLGGD